MDKVLPIFSWVAANYQVVLSSLVGVCSALIALFMLVPGSAPEKQLQWFVDLISKFSKKPQ